MSMNPTPKPRHVEFRPARSPDPAASSLVDAAVAEYRQRLALHDLVGYLLAVTGLGGLALLAAVVADHVWPGGLPRIGLAVISITWSLALLLGCGAAILLTVGRRLNPLFVAQQLERASRIHSNSLVNALLLRTSPLGAYAGEAVVNQAAHDLETHPSARLVGVRTNRRPAALLAAAAAAWMAYIGFAPKPIGPSLARVFGSGSSAPTATRLELLEPGPDDVVHVGDAVTLVVAVRGHPTDRVLLELLPSPDADTPTRTQTAYTRNGDHVPLEARFSLAPFEVRGDLHYRLKAGDARLSGTIPVHPRPGADKLEITIEPPAYTGQAPRRAHSPDLDVLYGSTGVFRIEANVDIREPVFVLESDGQTRTRMKVDPANPRVASLKRLLTESGRYAIEFSDTWGYPHRDPPRHRITVHADEAPTVAFVTPPESAGDIVDVRRVSELLVTAEDDVGVARLVLTTERDGEREKVVLHDESPAKGRRVVKQIATADLQIELGEVLRVWCEAEDGRATLEGQPDPQTARTRTLTLVYPERKEPTTAPSNESDDSAAPGQQPVSTGEDGVRTGETAEGAGTGDEGHQQSDRTQDPGDDAESSRPGESGEGPGDSAGTGEASDATKAIERPGGQGGEPGAGQQDDANSGQSGESATDPADGDRGDQCAGDSGDQPANDAPSAGDNKSDAAGGTDEGDPGEDSSVDREMEDFVRRHGEEAGEAIRGLRGQDSDSGSASSGSDDGTDEKPEGQQQPSGSTEDGSTSGKATPPADSQSEAAGKADAAEGGDKPDASRPEPQASEDSTNGSDETPPNDAEKPDQGAASGDRSQDPPTAGQPKPPSGEDTNPDSQGPAGPPGENNRPASGGNPSETDRQQGVPEDQPAAQQEKPKVDDSPQQPAKPPNAKTDSLDSDGVADTLDLLEMLERGERVDEDRLVELGWPRPRAAAFARALKRLHEAARAAARGEPLRQYFDAELGSAERQRGAGMSGDVERTPDSNVAQREGLERIAPPPEQDVPDSLRDVLDAYYQSLAERRASEGD